MSDNSFYEEHIKAFCEKQGLQFERWMNNEVGLLAVFYDHPFTYVFNDLDILWDLNSEQPKGRIIEWYIDNTVDPTTPSYFQYTKNCIK